jgi:hypothetical protein
MTQNSFSIPQQQAFSGQRLQSGIVGAGYTPISQAWSYRLQPMSTSNAMSTGTSQQQLGGQQFGGQQHIQNAQSFPVSSGANMQQQST